MTSAEEQLAGFALMAAIGEEDVTIRVTEDVDGDMPEVDGRDAHVVFDVFARELALAGFEIVRKL